jgi:hypothetical protein
MGKHRIKPNYRRRVLRLPDLDHCAASMSMPSTSSSPGTAPSLGWPYEARLWDHVEIASGTQRVPNGQHLSLDRQLPVVLE